MILVLQLLYHRCNIIADRIHNFHPSIRRFDRGEGLAIPLRSQVYHCFFSTLKRKGSQVEFVEWHEGARCDRWEREREIFKWPRRMRVLWRWWRRRRWDRNRTNTPYSCLICRLESVGGLTTVCVIVAVTEVAGMISKPGAAGTLTTTVVGIVGTAGLCGVRGCVTLRKPVCWSTGRAWSFCRRARKWSKPVGFAMSERKKIR